GHRGVLEQALLDLAGADPIAARLDDIVGPALEPEVAVLALAREIAGAQPGSAKLGRGGLGLVPVPEQKGGVRTPNHPLPDLAAGHGAALLGLQPHLVA